MPYEQNGGKWNPEERPSIPQKPNDKKKKIENKKSY